MTTTTDNQSTGSLGEELACQRLVDRGWTILARNWRSGRGEVDIVASDPRGTLVLVEVKTRRGDGYGNPLEAITYAKLGKLREMASRWFREQGRYGCRVRIDAIGVTLTDDEPVICHIEGVS